VGFELMVPAHCEEVSKYGLHIYLLIYVIINNIHWYFSFVLMHLSVWVEAETMLV
jgi:hypothetical protein